MCEPTMIMLTMLAGTGMSAYGQREAAKTNERIQDINAYRSHMASEDAIERGELEANRTRREARRVQGSQRAALAANGVVIDEGTALSLQEDTGFIGELDAQTILENSRREARGYQWDALGSRLQGQQYRNQSRIQPAATILGGSANAAGTYMSLNR